MSTFLTGCNIEENIEVPKESLKLTRPIRSRRPQSHRAGSTSKKTQLKEDRDFQMSYDEDMTSRKENGRFGKRAKVDETKMRNFTKGGIRRSKDGAFQLIKNSNSLEKDYESCKD